MSVAGHIVKMFRSDDGKEIACEKVHRVLADRGITLLLSTPYANKKNGLAERENHTVVELSRS
jgi:transposase InsO family protein